ncbi:hypothetical protein SEA_GRETCHEN_60 [Microbacterium phage Gretchen]|uniref:Uncharacterized protein n=1 Tax=Microbacterium phage Percival TaxID=2201439 RepID=A0A2Z4Q6N0_9CAUD|nr:hypothetical protein PBI_PERCIVAL_61 [Microbacterium phage Percival]UDL14834.1 hypothetical protein SEA_GRETCHEN_60 [Microbacterium phage Gretchen]
MRKAPSARIVLYMSNIRYTAAQRLALAVKRDAALVAQRATMSEADIAEVIGSAPGEAVTLSSGRVIAWADFVPAYRAGDVLNAHRGIIERAGALR